MDGRPSNAQLGHHGDSGIGVAAVEGSGCHAGRPSPGRRLCAFHAAYATNAKAFFMAAAVAATASSVDISRSSRLKGSAEIGPS